MLTTRPSSTYVVSFSWCILILPLWHQWKMTYTPPDLMNTLSLNSPYHQHAFGMKSSNHSPLWGINTPIFCQIYSKIYLGRGLINMSSILSSIGTYFNLIVKKLCLEKMAFERNVIFFIMHINFFRDIDSIGIVTHDGHKMIIILLIILDIFLQP